MLLLAYGEGGQPVAPGDGFADRDEEVNLKLRGHDKPRLTLATLFVDFCCNQLISTCIIPHVPPCTKPAPVAAFVDYHVDSKRLVKRAIFESPTLRHPFLYVADNKAR